MDERIIDHIVYAVPNLEEAMNWFQGVSGVRPVFGGYHMTEGTKNALINLSNGAYLEFLAVDQSNNTIEANRWMGIDLIRESKVTRWALKSKNLHADAKTLKAYNPEMGRLKGGQRKMANNQMLTWELAMPLATPEIELVPFMTDWQNSDIHPTDSLEKTCTLLDLTMRHPHPGSCSDVLSAFGYKDILSKGESPEISIRIQCPKGIIEL